MSKFAARPTLQQQPPALSKPQPALQRQMVPMQPQQPQQQQQQAMVPTRAFAPPVSAPLAGAPIPAPAVYDYPEHVARQQQQQQALDAKLPKYELLVYAPPPPGPSQYGACALFHRKLSQPFPAFREWFSRQYKGAADNWMTEPPGYQMPTVETDPLPVNPNVHITGEWRQAFSKYYKVTIKVLNKRAIHQPCRTDPSKDVFLPGMEEFELDRMPFVVKRASVGPNPGYIFQGISDDGIPVSTADGHTIDWIEEPRRRYGMSTAFDAEAKLFDRILEELAAFIVRQGKECVIPSVQNDIVKHGYSPTKAYLELIAHMRTHMPFVEHPPTRSQQTDNSWQDDPNSSSPNMPEITAQCNMTKDGEQNVLPKQRKDALQQINFSNQRKMAISWAHSFFEHMGGQKYKPFPVSRAELRVDARDRRADLVSIPMTEEAMLTEIHTNSVVMTRVRPTLKLTKPDPQKPERLFKDVIELVSVTLIGPIKDVGYQVRGYVPMRTEVQRVNRVEIDDDVAYALGEMATYKPEATRDTEMQRYLEEAPVINSDELEMLVAGHASTKADAEAQKATAAAAAAPGDARLRVAADAADRRAKEAAVAYKRAQDAFAAGSGRERGRDGATVEEMDNTEAAQDAPADHAEDAAGDGDAEGTDAPVQQPPVEEPTRDEIKGVVYAVANGRDPDVDSVQKIVDKLNAKYHPKAPIQSPPAAAAAATKATRAKRPAPVVEEVAEAEEDAGGAEPVGDAAALPGLPVPDSAGFQSQQSPQDEEEEEEEEVPLEQTRDPAADASGVSAAAAADGDDDDDMEDDPPVAEILRARMATTPVRATPAPVAPPAAPARPSKRSRAGH